VVVRVNPLKIHPAGPGQSRLKISGRRMPGNVVYSKWLNCDDW